MQIDIHVRTMVPGVLCDNALIHKVLFSLKSTVMRIISFVHWIQLCPGQSGCHVLCYCYSCFPFEEAGAHLGLVTLQVPQLVGAEAETKLLLPTLFQCFPASSSTMFDVPLLAKTFAVNNTYGVQHQKVTYIEKGLLSSAGTAFWNLLQGWQFAIFRSLFRGYIIEKNFVTLLSKVALPAPFPSDPVMFYHTVLFTSFVVFVFV